MAVFIELLNPNNESITSNTCLANSLVGIITKRDPLDDFINNSRIGIQNAAVLPVPV